MTILNKPIKRFYDQFSLSRLAQNIANLNLRQEAAIKFCRTFINPNCTLLELGCGVGIIAKSLSAQVQTYLATDISDKAIEIAKVVLSESDVEIKKFDVVCDDCEILASHGPFDTVIMMDVIEHVPLSEQEKVLRKIETLLKCGGQLILTYPTPEYQDYLMEFKKEELQIVDEKIYLQELLVKTTLRPIFYTTVDVWKTQQYAHLVLEKSTNRALMYVPRSPTEWRIRNARSQLWKLKNRKILKSLNELKILIK